ncbi:NnrU family protein [Leisingera methylohalidivorans]|uniref:NnrU family protein n=1 Tax=Leisingera methylohalidivorans DSM 14336 TaxID=999552 RepID=V9VUR1_9RHOB|nr:NnrU family protein [Leisingera methylohalidivorans]AHD01429.1 NnrU family protein [Leisingera methylohalidivorans DSM 14336]
MGWLEFTAALALFLLSHAIPVRPPVRPWLVRRLGLRGYFTAYSLLSLAILAWLVVAAARAPNAGVLPHWNLFRWAPLLLMPLACLLAVAGMMRQNPFSFGGLGLRAFDPADPGILAVSRHPLLAAMALWAGAHLLANGDLAHVILFGLFAGFAWIGMALIDSRTRRRLGQGEWNRLSRNTARLNLARLRPAMLEAVLAAAVFLVLLILHAPVIGYQPLSW